MLMKSKYRSELKGAKAVALLTKLASLYAERKASVVIEKGSFRAEGDKLTSLVITPAAAEGTVVYDPGTGEENYDLADISYIKRLRSRKWKIVINANADPAAPVVEPPVGG